MFHAIQALSWFVHTPALKARLVDNTKVSWHSHEAIPAH